MVLVGGVAAYGAWYTSSLASNMALDAQEQSELSSVLAPSDSQMEPFYVLLVGSDNWETYGERSDALVLVRIDPVGHVITMVSVPRDTPYEYNGKVEKINQMFAVNGAAGAVTAVQDLTGVKISDYVEIEFAGLAEFVDSIGGIYVDVPYTIDYQVYTQDQAPVHIEAGNQLLNGEQCVALARMRTAYGDDQEAIRQSNVRAMAMALMKNVLQAPPVEIPRPDPKPLPVRVYEHRLADDDLACDRFRTGGQPHHLHVHRSVQGRLHGGIRRPVAVLRGSRGLGYTDEGGRRRRESRSCRDHR